jgi:hypothetical protein
VIENRIIFIVVSPFFFSVALLIPASKNLLGHFEYVATESSEHVRNQLSSYVLPHPMNKYHTTLLPKAKN